MIVLSFLIGEFMEYFKKILQKHAKLHPAILPQDIVKLCYQATFGAEHLLLHRDKAFDYFMHEYIATPTESTSAFESISSNHTNKKHTTSTTKSLPVFEPIYNKNEHITSSTIELLPLFEPICASYARCNFSAWKKQNLPAEWLFEMFYHTASQKSAGTEELFWNYIQIAESLLTEHIFSFSEEEWNDYISYYQKNGVRAVHHSENYQKNECPAYRLIDSRYTKLLPILEKLAKQTPTNTTAIFKPTVIAIDGRAGAGKSTIAQLLSDILNAPIIQMDDFFLPPALRNESRLQETGGNVHYERFYEEVLPFLKKNTPFSYRRFDCHRMNYNGKKEIPTSMWYIVEGSYSMHPTFGNYMDISVFCDISAEKQRKRICLRNGEAMLKRFTDTWIPMEEHYFETEHIRKRCDVVLFP